MEKKSSHVYVTHPIWLDFVPLIPHFHIVVNFVPRLYVLSLWRTDGLTHAAGIMQDARGKNGKGRVLRWRYETSRNTMVDFS